MELQLLHERPAEKDLKSLMDYIQRMASGEAPFFSTTLSLVYDKLVENAFANPTFGSVPEKPTGSQGITTPTPPSQASTSTSSIVSHTTINAATSSSNLQAPASVCGLAPPRPTTNPVASSSDLQVPTPVRWPTLQITPANSVWLKCVQCGELAQLRDLYNGLRCPRCPGIGKKRPLMRCTACFVMRTVDKAICDGRNCKKQLM